MGKILPMDFEVENIS